MRVAELALDVATVTAQDQVRDALRLLAEHRMPGLIVLDDHRRPRAVLPATQVVRMGISGEYQEDGPLARVIDEAAADVFTEQRAASPIGECLPPRPEIRAIVDGDATLLEVACLMARTHSPIVAVVDHGGIFAGAVTLTMVLERLSRKQRLIDPAPPGASPARS